MIATIQQWKNEFVDSSIQICARPVTDHTESLTPQELTQVEAAVAKRQYTFSTGRKCAKDALLKIGIESHHYPNGLLTQEDGSVAWPDGSIGSISHTNDWAMAALANRGGKFQSIGVDIEKIDRVEKGVLRLIATDSEREFLDTNSSLRWGRVAVFSIKESVYKCLRPIYGKFIRFKDVELSNLDRPHGNAERSNLTRHTPTFYQPSVRIVDTALAACCAEQRIDIRLAVLDEHVVSVVGYAEL